jgi:hypothetical protein
MYIFGSPMRRLLLTTLVLILLALISGVAVRYAHYRTPISRNATRLGVLPDLQSACRAGFPILIANLRADPSASEFAVDWHYEGFLSYLISADPAASGYLELSYDRKDQRFAVFEPANGPTYFDWRKVTPSILFSVSDSNADFTNLSAYGCASGLP